MASFLHVPLSALAAFWLCVSTAPVFSSQSVSESRSDVPNAFEIIPLFEDAVAVLDTNPNPIFKCLTATRTSYDPKAPSATYRWTLNSNASDEMKHPELLYTPASTLDTANTVVNSDASHSLISRALYTDGSTCVILEMENFGKQCTLWVLPKVKDSVPEKCFQGFTELCGEGVSLYDKEACGEAQP